jgi:hypothetical protein
MDGWAGQVEARKGQEPGAIDGGRQRHAWAGAKYLGRERGSVVCVCARVRTVRPRWGWVGLGRVGSGRPHFKWARSNDESNDDGDGGDGDDGDDGDGGDDDETGMLSLLSISDEGREGYGPRERERGFAANQQRRDPSCSDSIGGHSLSLA